MRRLTQESSSVCAMLVEPQQEAVMMAACAWTSAAKRRRERLLRSMLRHERQTVAMELAAALHHSCGVRLDVSHEVLRERVTASPAGARPGGRPEGARAAVGGRSRPVVASSRALPRSASRGGVEEGEGEGEDDGAVEAGAPVVAGGAWGLPLAPASEQD